ncbi:MAG TPA: hypothetical protein VFH48_25080 [Chloroflexota bacterium]|nr:hypothetical protein [Chloroflexota bacterium]
MIEFILRSGIAKRIAIGTVVLVIGCSVWTPITLILSARTYANHVMTTSFATWDATVLASEIEPTSTQETPSLARRRFEAWSQRLGTLQSHRIAQMNTNVVLGSQAKARVTIEADFERAQATISLELTRSGSAWKITSWAIRSPSGVAPAARGVSWSDGFDDLTTDACADLYDGPAGVIECSGGELRLARLDMLPGGYMLQRLGSRLADGTLAIDAHLEGGAEHRHVGIGCRDQGSERSANYQFIIVPALAVGALYRAADGEPDEMYVTDWIESSAIRPGAETNRLELSCVGLTIAATVNGTRLFTIEDPTYQRGYFFAYVEVGNAAVPLDARFDNTVIKERE